MRASRCGLLGGLLVGCLIGSASGAKPEPAPEVKWVKGIADDFWKALLNNKEEQAAGLLSPELAKAVVTYERWGGVGGELKDVTPAMYLRGLVFSGNRTGGGIPAACRLCVDRKQRPHRTEALSASHRRRFRASNTG